MKLGVDNNQLTTILSIDLLVVKNFFLVTYLHT